MSIAELHSLAFISLALRVGAAMFDSTLSLWTVQSVLGMGSLSWSRPQVRPVIGWPLSQALSHHCPSTSYRQDRLQVEGMWLGSCPRTTTGSLVWLQDRRWPVQALCSSLVGVLARMPPKVSAPEYTRFLHHPTNAPPFQLSLPIFSPSVLPSPTQLHIRQNADI